MRKILIIMALGAFVTGTSVAQETLKNEANHHQEGHAEKDGTKGERKSPEERAARKAELLAKKYNLNQAQQAKLQALHQKHANEMAALHVQRGNGVKPTNAQRKNAEAKHAQWESELKAILTPEQHARYQADRASKRNDEHRGKKKGFSKKLGERKQEKKS